VNVDGQTLDDVFQAVKALHKEAPSRTRHFFYYLLGRFESKAAEGPVKTFLNAVKDELTKELGDDVVRPERILRQAQVRTVFVSLIYLGDQDALADYIRRLLEDQEAASVNRGFHRIYYGDVTADSGAGGERYLDDESGAWDRSRQALEARIERALSDSRLSDNDVLFEIRLFTLISFVQSRSGRGLDEAGAARLKEVIAKSLERIENEELAAYIRSFCIDLERRSFAPWDFIIDLYALKTARRQGWLDRGLHAPVGISVESVADHTYLACLLAWFLLPERDGADPAYSKSRIIELLLMHDVAEAFIGDQVVVQMDDAKRKRYVEEERGAMHYIRMKDTYPGIWGGNVGFERWQEFEKHGTRQPENINARIAKDIDRLENLIQLHLYAHALSVETTERFRQDLLAKIETARVCGLSSEFERWAESRKTIEPQSSSFYRERLCGPGGA
jgi:5'-deoxynucleotidase YfbR-like HD superfamily hydrolase